METISNSKDTVTVFIEALNQEDFDSARKYVTDNLKFIGAMGQRDGGDVYIADMKKMKLKYKLKKPLPMAKMFV